MTMELPSINSTTSISDNTDLRNYYDKLLFTNASGKSLNDLPRKAHAAQQINKKVNETIHEEDTERAPRIDFIEGFGHSPRANVPLSPPQEHARRRSIFFENSLPHQNNSSNDRNENRSLGGNMTLSPDMMLTPLNSGFGSAFGSANIFNEARRSSYIADSLIHNQNIHEGQNLEKNGTIQDTYSRYAVNADMKSPTFNNHQQHFDNPTRMELFGTGDYVSRRNSQPAGANQFQQSQNANQFTDGNYYKNTNGNNFQAQYPYDYYAYNQKPQQTAYKPTYDYNYGVRQQPQQNPNYYPNTQVGGNDSGDNGLVVIDSKQLASSDKLYDLYQECGSKYFSAKEVFEFMDYLKPMLEATSNENELSNVTKSRLYKFLGFLKSCNLNYNPQSEAFVTANMNNRRGKGTASSYLHYKPLVLGALKNGKLELLSIPQNSNLALKKGDLVIVDGDRGKDLILVVEPIVDLNLALIINFLKKKIHFDSLITNKNQHYPIEKFVKALIDSTNGVGDELNPKLYDIIELTQLVVPSKQVLRFANSWEVTTNLHNKFQDELKALHIAQLKLRSLNSGLNHNHRNNSGNSTESNSSSGTPPNESTDTSGNKTEEISQKVINKQSYTPRLNIKILNAEFQFDRKKLTFYYVCEERNDFRELIKELFKFYKTRIWLCAIPNNLEIDRKYYDPNRKEMEMYQKMMQQYSADDYNNGNDNNSNGVKDGLVVAPPLKSIELDNFQIGVYTELVEHLFNTPV
ncbi:PSP1 C-terminal conserved region [Nakaseomyces glabratus]|nr:PSP1 C-terminal conserved region [Nakaseomyces glabratus]